MAEISQENYNLVAQLVRGYSGLHLGVDKSYLIKNRLEPLLPEMGLLNLDQLFDLIKKQDRDREVVRKVAEAMATYESYFFRDKAPFETLVNELIPALLSSKKRNHIRIWSAACSFGQEPYSIAMAIEQARSRLGSFTYEVLATDFSQQALLRARTGMYTKFEASRGLTGDQISKYFTNTIPEGHLVVRDFIKKQVSFLHLNFMDPFDQLGLVDIIFCRNVLIYFTIENKKNILERMGNLLAEDGFVILGAMETVHGITDSFISINKTDAQVFVKGRMADSRNILRAS